LWTLTGFAWLAILLLLALPSCAPLQLAGDPAALAEATDLNKEAVALHMAGEYVQAEPLYRQSLAIREKAVGPEHPDVALSLYSLALLCHDQRRYAEAEPLYRRSLAIAEKVLGPGHPNVAMTLNNLAELYRA
jgi:tetratricopeptide (TPR) repeat protein